MQMTHYMELLAQNQPWNLIIFMAIPVILAETIAISELYILFTRKFDGIIKKINSISSILIGIYFTFIFFYLFITVFIPLTISGSWRGLVDIVAVTFYLLGVIPLVGVALIDMNILKKNQNKEEKLKLHSIFVAIFLIVAHIAMIFGMINPSVFDYQKNQIINESHDNMIME